MILTCVNVLDTAFLRILRSNEATLRTDPLSDAISIKLLIGKTGNIEYYSARHKKKLKLLESTIKNIFRL